MFSGRLTQGKQCGTVAYDQPGIIPDGNPVANEVGNSTSHDLLRRIDAGGELAMAGQPGDAQAFPSFLVLVRLRECQQFAIDTLGACPFERSPARTGSSGCFVRSQQAGVLA